MKKFLFSILIMAFLIFCFLKYAEHKRDTSGTLLITSSSPNDKYELKGYLGGGDATVDYAVLVDLYDKKSGKRIQKRFYYEYHESELSIEWESNTKVKINDKTLSINDLKKHDFTVYED